VALEVMLLLKDHELLLEAGRHVAEVVRAAEVALKLRVVLVVHKLVRRAAAANGAVIVLTLPAAAATWCSHSSLCAVKM
jgi:hypothetical protein